MMNPDLTNSIGRLSMTLCNDVNHRTVIMETKEVILATGKKCSFSGEWEVAGIKATTVYLSKGESMPYYCGKEVKWILIKKG